MRLLVAGLALLLPATAHAADVRIEHSPISCAVAGRYPVIDAQLEPADSVSRAAIRFRAGTGTDWYAVAMKPHGPAFQAVLPRPKKSLDHFEYYIDVTDRAFATSRTPEQTVQVSSTAAGCHGRMMAGTVASASMVLEAAAGAPAVPVGFGSAGVATATATGTAAAAAGGGLGALGLAAIVGGGAAVAGVAVVASGHHDDANGSSSNGGPPPVRAHYQVSFPLPGMDLSVCAGRPLSWTDQAIDVAGGTGSFDTTWSPSEPNVLHVSGSVTDTVFTAQINCVSGAATGTLSATGSGGTYQGTFSLGGKGGPMTVTRGTTGS
jgi:hypothetical protein